MTRSILIILAALVASSAMFSCGSRTISVQHDRLKAMPRKILWAWERPEDLTFLDPKQYGVAFLAQTIHLEKDAALPRSRRQLLNVAPNAYMIAVTRIETSKGTFERPTFSDEMIAKTAALISSTLDLPDVRAIQIDFDATVSERNFYRSLTRELKAMIPPETPLTMTALASWCVESSWFNDFSVDEAVPMVFQMGADDEKIRAFLRNGNDWSEPFCRGSYGLSVDEPALATLKSGRRTYYFSNSAWKSSDLERLR